METRPRGLKRPSNENSFASSDLGLRSSEEVLSRSLQRNSISDRNQKIKINNDDRRVKTWNTSRDNLSRNESSPVVKYMEPFTTAFAPEQRSDLLTSFQTLKKLETWLLESKKKQSGIYGRILVIAGPSGCGKMSALRILAQELKLEMKEFIPMEFNKEDYKYRCANDQDNKSSQDLLMTHLRTFIRSSLIKSASGKLMLLKEIPDLFLRQPSLFHQTLASALPHVSSAEISNDESALNPSRKSSPIVIIFTTGSSTTTSFGGDADAFGGTLSLDRFLPSAIVKQFQVHVIKFNALKTPLVKMLNRRSSGKLTSSQVETLANLSCGDIRHALNSLEWLLRSNPDSLSCPLTSNKRHKTALHPRDAIDNALLIVGRDQCVSFFHSLAKVLYAKRETDRDDDVDFLVESDKSSSRKSDRNASPKMITNHYRVHQLQLKDSAFDIVMSLERMVQTFSSKMSHNSVLDYLFEHYSEYIVGPSESGNVETASQIAHYISLADGINLDVIFRLIESGYRSRIATSAHMYYTGDNNCRKESPTEDTETASQWRSIHKPKYASLTDALNAFHNEVNSVQSLLPMTVAGDASSGLLDCASRCTYVRRKFMSAKEAIMDYAPYVQYVQFTCGGLSEGLPLHLQQYTKWMTTFKPEYSALSNPVSHCNNYRLRQSKGRYKLKSREKDSDDEADDSLSINIHLTEAERNDYFFESD